VGVQIKQLRILSAVLLGFAIGQAGLGSGYLGGAGSALLIAHATNAFAVLVLTALTAIFGFNYRRAGGPGWAFFLPAAMLVMVGIQITLGFAGIRGAAGIRGIHVFWGVLYLCTATAFCSNIWRHRPTATAQSTAKTASTR
jgi:hypothetical protein